MSIQAPGALGERVAAIATIGTLLYLAVQVRQNNRNLQDATPASINQGFAGIHFRLSSDEQFAELFIRGREELGASSPV